MQRCIDGDRAAGPPVEVRHVGEERDAAAGPMTSRHAVPQSPIR
jgi:hypothetical protein